MRLFLPPSSASSADCVAGPDLAASDDSCPQSASMHQGFADLFAGELGEVPAGLAHSQPLEFRLPNDERFADQMIECHAARNDVSPRIAGGDLQAVVSLERFDRLNLDQGNFAVRRIGLPECPCAVGVTVAVQALALVG